MENGELIFAFAILITAASALGFVAKFVRVPLIVAYIFAGFLLSTLALKLPQGEIFSFLPAIGIAFLLFLIGSELDLREIRNLGRPIFLASIFQMLFSAVSIFLLSQVFGFTVSESVYLGFALGFSSTIIVVKLFSDRGEMNSLPGKLAIGILLIEDLIAVAALMSLSLRASVIGVGVTLTAPLLALVVKAAVLFLITYIAARHLLPKLFKIAAGQNELLFLSGVSVCFAFVALSIFLGFSLEIGAFLGGISIASSPYHFEIAGRIKPLRDLFVTIFFVDLGARVGLAIDEILIIPILFFSAWALFVKPTVFLFVLGRERFRKHTIFKTSIGLSQISEFSLILVFAGLKSQQVGEEALSTVAFTALLTMAVSSVLITKSELIYKKLRKFVAVFESKNPRESVIQKVEGDLNGHILLLGCDRTGRRLLPALKKLGVPFVVVDFNPEVVNELIAGKVNTIYGDISDPEVLELVNFEKAGGVISTITDFEDNLALLAKIRKFHKRPITIMVASYPHDALKLYEAGADYVVLPNLISGEHLAEVIEEHAFDQDFYKKKKERHFIRLTREKQYHLSPRLW